MKLVSNCNKMRFTQALACVCLLPISINASTCPPRTPFKLLSPLEHSAGSEIRVYKAMDLKLCQRTCRQYFECSGVLMKWTYGENQQVGDCHLLSAILEGSVAPRYNVSLYAHGYRDCGAVYDAGFAESGVYTIQTDGFRKQVYCDMDTDGGGWTVLLQRLDGSVDFNRGWKQYKNGFGDAAGEYWLGNEPVHILTSSSKTYALRIDVIETYSEDQTSERNTVYPNVTVSNEAGNYTINFEGYDDDLFGVYPGRPFSTSDRPSDYHCAKEAGGGWWYSYCRGLIHGTGPYDLSSASRGIRGGYSWWYHATFTAYSMKIRATT